MKKPFTRILFVLFTLTLICSILNLASCTSTTPHQLSTSVTTSSTQPFNTGTAFEINEIDSSQTDTTIANSLHASGVANPIVQTWGGGNFLVEIPSSNDASKIMTILEQHAIISSQASISVSIGNPMTMKNGTALLFGADLSQKLASETDSQAMVAVQSTLLSRLHASGISSPVIQIWGDEILVEIPTINSNMVNDLISDGLDVPLKILQQTSITSAAAIALTSSTKSVIDKTFPEQLDASSFTPISQADAAAEMQSMQLSDKQNNTIQLYLPIDQETLDSSPNLGYNQQFIGELPSYVNQAELENVKNLTQMNGLSDGTVVYAPVGGIISVLAVAGQSTGTPEEGYYTPSYSAVIIDLSDIDGTSLNISLGVLGGIPMLDLSKATYGESSVTIEAGQPLFKISAAKAVGGEPISGQAGQIDINAGYKQENPPAPIPLAIDFIKKVITQ